METLYATEKALKNSGSVHQLTVLVIITEKKIKLDVHKHINCR